MSAVVRTLSLIHILDPHSEQSQILIRRFEEFAHAMYAARVPQITLLPSLSQFNVIRALQENIKVLGLLPDELSDDAISPFNSPNSLRFASSPPHQIPSSLAHTQLQVTTIHHPWIDLLPIPALRDNLLRRGLESFDEDELCHDIRGRTPGHNPGMLVWRDPWDVSGWEVTPAFVRSWGWALVGCWHLLRSTNAWRAKRGEGPLFRIPDE